MLHNRLSRVASTVRLASKEELLSKRYNIPIEQLQEWKQYDPAKGKHLEWMAKEVITGRLRLPELADVLTPSLEKYMKIKASPRLLEQYEVGPDINTLNFN